MSRFDSAFRERAPDWRSAGLVVYRAFSDLVGKGAFFLVTIAAARRLDQDSFGIFSLGTTLGWIAAVASDFGIQLHAARAIAQRPHEAARTLTAWGRVRLTTAVVAMAVLVAGITIVGVPAHTAVAIVLLAMVYIASSLLEFLFYACRGLGRTDVESTLTIAQRSATLVLGVGALIWWPDVRVLAAALLVPMAATLLYATPRVADLARRRSASRDVAAAGEATLSADTGSVFALGAGIVLSALYFRIDVFLIEMWRGTEAVALYNAVFRLVEALRLLPAAVLAVALPAMFRSSSRRLPLQLSALVAGGGAVIAAVLMLSADWLVALIYGPSFAEAAPALRVLLLAFPLMCLNYVLTQQLVGWHRHGAWAASCAAALVFNIAINTELIPSLGIVGAAWATVWTETFIMVACGAALALTTVPGADVGAVQSAVL